MYLQGDITVELAGLVHNKRQRGVTSIVIEQYFVEQQENKRKYQTEDSTLLKKNPEYFFLCQQKTIIALVP